MTTTVVDLLAGGRSHRLRIWTPPTPPPAAGYPVLWVLDGDGYQGLASDMVRNRGSLGHEIAPAVVVAVGYATDDIGHWMRERFFDFSPTPPGPGPFESVAGGGLESFLDMIEDDALPAVAAHAAIDRRRMALFGHSMGGLAVLHALFTRTALFESCVAVSPAIWWNDRVVLGNEAAFAARVQSGVVAPRVFIAVGALEQQPVLKLPAGAAGTPEQASAHVAAQRVVDNAAELAARLQALRGARGYGVQYAALPGQTHMSVPFAAFGQALDLALPVG